MVQNELSAIIIIRDWISYQNAAIYNFNKRRGLFNSIIPLQSLNLQICIAMQQGLAMRAATVSSAVQTEPPTNEMLTSTPDVSLVELPSGSRSEESILASPSVSEKTNG